MTTPTAFAARVAWTTCLLAALALAPANAPASAAVRSARGAAPHSTPPSGVRIFDLERRLDVNRVNMFTTNFGHIAFDIASGNAGFIWPKGSGKTAIFASGLWLGGTVNGETRVAVAEYSSEYGPGSMVGGTYGDPEQSDYKTYKVMGWHGDPADTTHVDRTPAELAADPQLDPVAHHSWSEYLAGAAPHGAPTRTYHLPDTSTPDPNDFVDVLGPDVLGDQMLWCVYNDADPSRHVAGPGQTAPLGVEIQQSIFGFNRMDDLGDVVFLRFHIANKGGNTLEDFHVSLWSDPDVGAPTDDLEGCDPPRSLGFAYNAQNTDAIYGTPPPAVGYVLLRGAADQVGGGPLGLTAFSKYVNGTDPFSFTEVFNYMHGLHADGTDVIDPTTGLPTMYFVPGDPLTGSGWIDAMPGDRRFLMTTGPSRMLPGESQNIWAAIAMGRGQDRLASVATVRCVSELARAAFEQGFSPLPDQAQACSTSVSAGLANCPKPAAYWGLECAAGGSGQLNPAQLDSVAAFVNAQSALFDWPTNTRDQFCATVSPPGSPDLRQQAKSQFATFLANYSGNQINLSIGAGQAIRLVPSTPVSCPPLTATTILELAARADLTRQITSADYLNLDPTHRRALEGVNFGLPFFFGGAGEGNDLFGSTLSGAANPDSFATVEIRFDHTATQQCYRYLRLEKMDGSAPILVGRYYPYSGFYDCPFQVWDVDHNVQLDAAFVERGLVIDDNGTLSPDTSTTIPSMDRTWDPSDDAFGDREYLFVFNRPYGAASKDEFRVADALNFGAFPVLYVLTSKLRASNDLIDDGDQFKFVWGLPPSPGADRALFDLESQSLADPAVQQAYIDLNGCLSAINAGIGIGPTCESGPTPVLISLVSADASPELIRLRWYAGEGLSVATVERRTGGSDWVAMARVIPDGERMIAFDDHDVAAGAAYDYRLAVVGPGGTEYLGAAHVEVPSDARLAFQSARPDPAGPGLLVSFSLAGREPARIEVLDIAGRRMAVRALSGLDPGSHTLAVGEGRLPSGVYLVRIVQDRRSVTGKAAIVR